MGRAQVTEWTEERLFAAIYRTYGPVGSNAANVCVRHIPAYHQGWITSGRGTTYEGEKKRYIDALVMTGITNPRLWAVEIKVTKADLNSELKDPSKSEAWARHVHGFYLAVPPDLVDYAKTLIPSAWGVISIKPHHIGYTDSKREQVEVYKRAKTNKDPEPFDTRTWWAMARRAGKRDYEECR